MRENVPFPTNVTNYEQHSLTLVTQRGLADLEPVTWKPMLEMARRCGWVPAGTLPPAGVSAAEWSGEYFPGVGQLITAEDARGLAEGVRRGLPSIPDETHRSGDPVPFDPDNHDNIDVFRLVISDAPKQALAWLADWIGSGEVKIQDGPLRPLPGHLHLFEEEG